MLIGRTLDPGEQVPAIVALFTASGIWEAFLQQLKQNHNAVVIWNGPGGWLVIERQVVNEIQQLQKRQNIVFVVTQRAVSAQAFSLCYFDNVKVLPQAEVMFHQGIHLDGAKAETEQENEQCVKSGLMTPMDVAQMMNNNQEVHVTFDKDGKRHVRYEDDPRFTKPSLEALVK
jgi:hypothetical protein